MRQLSISATFLFVANFTDFTFTRSHLKCDNRVNGCRRCRQEGIECVRTQLDIRFRPILDSKTGRAKVFRKDQPWVQYNCELRYVNETRTISSLYAITATPSLVASQDTEDGAILFENIGNDTNITSYTFVDDSISDTRVIEQEISPLLCPGTVPGTVSLTENDSDNDRNSTLSHTNRVGPQNRAVLVRYFIQELALWFDLCDATRHFGTVVPVRACQSPALLNAIYTAATRHLVRLQRYRNKDGVIEWQGNSLPSVAEETAFRFQNDCIRDLLRYSLDIEQIMNEDLLAASIILRTDEEMDVSIHDGEQDREVFLKVTSAFIDTQIPAQSSIHARSTQDNANTPWSETWSSPQGSVPTHYDLSSPVSHPTNSNQNPSLAILNTLHSEGLRQACFWVAFRQELHASMMQQRPLNFSLSRFKDFQTFNIADDNVWAHRIAVFCAEVVDNCYGRRRSESHRSRCLTWETLTKHEDMFVSTLPVSFNPIYHHLGDGAVFPELWFINACHVTGQVYLELARILLRWFDPHNPNLGPGYISHMRSLSDQLRTSTKKLCGMAISNRQAPPLFLNACSAIVMCGELFDDPLEQESILWFLRKTTNEVGYPTHRIATDLRRAWK